jgi:hypothetical protein
MISRDDLATVDGVLVGSREGERGPLESTRSLGVLRSVFEPKQAEQTRVVHAGPIC